MNKLLVFLLVAISFFVLLFLSSKASAGRNQSAIVNPIATPTPSAEIRSIDMDKDAIEIPCPSAWRKYRPKTDSPCDEDEETYGLVKIKTNVYNPKKKALTYQYTISGGLLTGEGENVVWNLGGTRPGSYTITVAINDGRGFNPRTQSRTISINENCCCMPICTCPTLVVTGGGGIKPGETVSFAANVSGGTAIDITYRWTVSQGEIIEGQGTSKITVKTTSEMAGNITAAVEISGDLCADCPRTASETATIIK